MKERMYYIGTLPCGCILGAQAITDVDQKTINESIAEFEKQGLTIDIKPSSWVRKNFGKCAAHDKSRQLELV